MHLKGNAGVSCGSCSHFRSLVAKEQTLLCVWLMDCEVFVRKMEVAHTDDIWVMLSNDDLGQGCAYWPLTDHVQMLHDWDVQVQAMLGSLNPNF